MDCRRLYKRKTFFIRIDPSDISMVLSGRHFCRGVKIANVNRHRVACWYPRVRMLNVGGLWRSRASQYRYFECIDGRYQSGWGLRRCSGDAEHNGTARICASSLESISLFSRPFLLFVFLFCFFLLLAPSGSAADIGRIQRREANVWVIRYPYRRYKK